MYYLIGGSLMDTELDTIFFIMDDQRQSLQYTTI